jgi:hypothetical protein
MYPLVGFWLDLCVVLVQLSRPGPLEERVGERKLERVRHFDERREVKLQLKTSRPSVGVFISLPTTPR